MLVGECDDLCSRSTRTWLWLEGHRSHAASRLGEGEGESRRVGSQGARVGDGTTGREEDHRRSTGVPVVG